MLHPNILGAYEKNKERAISQAELNVTADYKTEVQSNFARQTITTVDGKSFLENKSLHQEVFGPFSMVVQCEDDKELTTIISNLEGQLTGTLIAEDSEAAKYPNLIDALQN